MSLRQIDMILNGVNFQIECNPHTEQMEYTSIKKMDFELFLADDEEGENIVKDVNKVKEWLNVGLEGNLLLDFLVDNNYNPIYKTLKMNPFNIDVALFHFEWKYFTNNEDQRIELESNKLIGNTVNGRKFIEKIMST